MSAPSVLSKRPLWRTCLAVLAVVANFAVPAAPSAAASVSGIFGDNFSLCLASGGQAGATPATDLPNEPAAAALHCSLCLFTGGFEAPAGRASAVTIRGGHPVVLTYGYAEPAFAPQFHALQFHARAPPA
ncbi:MAG: hypothetical protein O3C49_00490 [Proteobacteria bacterium]|nr:hypothetical protein [Pseudomonadota bacterium]MDA1323969.1 hypothetical protein [Pseudomonadota bacterium]